MRVCYSVVMSSPVGRLLAAVSACVVLLSNGSSMARADGRHAVYVEALGKGGLYGVGYDVLLTRRLGLGVVGSYYLLGGDRFMRAVPYVALYPWRGARHGVFVQGGPQWIRRHTPSPGPEWPGSTTTSLGAEVSAGYEYRHRVLARAYVMGAMGERFAPGIGASVGWAL